MSSQKPTPAEALKPKNPQVSTDHPGAGLDQNPTEAKAVLIGSDARNEGPETASSNETTPYEQNGQNLPKEKNGFADLGLLEPTRYGDWDVKGRCSDF